MAQGSEYQHSDVLSHWGKGGLERCLNLADTWMVNLRMGTDGPLLYAKATHDHGRTGHSHRVLKQTILLEHKPGAIPREALPGKQVQDLLASTAQHKISSPVVGAGFITAIPETERQRISSSRLGAGAGLERWFSN